MNILSSLVILLSVVFPLKSFETNLLKDTVTPLNKEVNLNEIVITGTRTERRLSSVPILTTVIRNKEIRKSGAVSLLESLQDNIPGIVISPNAMGNNMRIRGLNSRYILLLVDGERLVSEGAGGNINLDQIDVNNIERIEMVNGAESALYGSNAVGAVINIITRKPVRKLESSANIIAQSHNTWDNKFTVSSRQDNLSAILDGFCNSSDGFGANGSSAYAARYRDWGSNLKVGYKPSERFLWNVISRFFRHESFNPAKSMDVKHPLNYNLTAGTNVSYFSADKTNALQLSLNWDKFFNYNVMEKIHDQKKKQNTADYFTTRFSDTYKSNDRWEIIGGFEYNHESNFAVKTMGSEPTTKALNDYNLFAQADWKIVNILDMVAGARYTYNDQFKSAFTPKVSFLYSLGRLKLRGGIGTSFRAPTIKELYYDFDHQGMFWIYGNPDLKAEKGLYSSLSAENNLGGFNASISFYHNHISDKITQYDVINKFGGDEKYYKNVSSAALQGFDINLSYIFLHDWVMKGSYSYCDARDNSTGLQLDSNVKHSGTVSLTWNGAVAKSPFSIQIAGRMNSPILYQEEVSNVDGSVTIDRTQSKTYSIWKTTILKPFNFRRHLIELMFKCDNIFNFKETSFINPGRQFLIGLRYEFK